MPKANGPETPVETAEQAEARELVERTDEAEYLPKRAQMAVAITFNERLTGEDKERVQQRVKDVLEAALKDGQLIPPYSRLPKPRIVDVRPLAHRCEHCQAVASPFIMV